MPKFDGLSQLFKGFSSLSANTNKVNEDDPDLEEGVISDNIPELKLSMPDDELIDLSRDWLAKYRKATEGGIDGSKSLKEKRKENVKYWLGKQFSSVEESTETRPLVDNLIFEALETFLPIANKQSPEPMVSSDDTEEGIALAKDIQKILNYLFDILKVRLKGKNAVRDWALKYVGAFKIGWSLLNNEIDLVTVKPENLILDPSANVVGGVYDGKFLGEWKKDTAGDLKRKFPSKKAFIDEISTGKDGTEIAYIEWWTTTALFWTLKGKVLDKVKNPHFNYEQEELQLREVVGAEDGQLIEDLKDEGLFETIKVEGNNHFPSPRIPYILLNVFSLGDHPWDDTSLIEQNLSMQDLINKRNRQIDKNVDGMNGGWAISLEKAGLTKEQATQAVKQFRKGGAVAIPRGNIREAVDRIVGQGLPNDVFNQLADARNELRGVFGVTGLQPQGLGQESTVRGKILNRGSDVDRIGGGITDHIEQWYDYLYNWMVQMMYVYYDEEHTASVLGDQGAAEFITLSKEQFNKKLVISVKEGSLLPKDPMTKRNVALDLWGAQAIDPLTLMQRIDDPNPRQAVERLIKWQSNPAGLLEEDSAANETAQGGQAPQAQAQGGGQIPQPSEATNILNQVEIPQ